MSEEIIGLLTEDTILIHGQKITIPVLSEYKNGISYVAHSHSLIEELKDKKFFNQVVKITIVK